MDQELFNELNIFKLGKDNIANSAYFSGKSYLNVLTNRADEISIANVTFEPGCRNNWHIHEGNGQVLLCIAGYGWYQEEGKEAISLEPGMVINIPIGVKHWHGAKKDSWFSHIAMSVNNSNHKTKWLEKVDDDEYAKL